MAVCRCRAPDTTDRVLILPVPGVFRPLDETWLLAEALCDEPLFVEADVDELVVIRGRARS